MPSRCVSKQTLQRLPVYLNFLKQYGADGPKNISATGISQALGLNQVVVRKDLASISTSGRPKVGYVRLDLIRELEEFLGYDNADDAILVGAGNLGRALLSYDGFLQYGLNILAAFDMEPGPEDKVGGKPVLPMEKLEELCERVKVRIGIITVPGDHAQAVCNLLIKSGILAIWNFANVHLDVPEGILVQNENMAVSLAILSNHLKEKFSTK